MKISVRPSICPFGRGFVISLNNVPIFWRQQICLFFVFFSKVFKVYCITIYLESVSHQFSDSCTYLKFAMNESYAMWRDNTIVGRALDLSLATYGLARLKTSELRYQEVGLQTFKNPGEFNFPT